ncbi:MAG: 50S ribosomal protein L25 [Candidatus Syntrophonatronum acetioxidans]|uniref:Large ribosomal subunit protein bL25 n=1 Tax=Candidatus Syntrophonatronum acetioxidans TaxID=1795816 RepID=A0A424YBW7_9FIRM|nr:MAG: 50S ribosomal protein L25 [Candidatus Syntrophonatronum acetioxidans]
MERLELNTVKREKTSKGAIKEMRKKGFIPAVVYGKEVENTLLAVDWKELFQALNTSAGSNVLIDLVMEDNGGTRKETVMVREVQKHPLKEFYLHVDFIGISLKDKVEVKVPIYFKGEPKGSREGGVPSIQIREVMVESLPTAIPEYLEVDVSDLDIGESLNIGDLMVPEGVEIVDDPEETIITVVVPTEVEEPVVEEEEELEEELEEAPEGEEAPAEDEGEEEEA